MDSGNSGRRFDDDIVRCKEEILRLKGRVPPFGQPPKRAVAAPVETLQRPQPTPEVVLPPVAGESYAEQAAANSSDGAFSDTAAFAASMSNKELFDTAAVLEHHEIVESQMAEAMPASVAESPEGDVEESEVPDFDLAQQIMAEQRKVVGNRRKGPGSPRVEIKEEEPLPASIPHSPAVVVAPAPAIRIVAMEAPMSPQQKVIADIVARDINTFYQTRKVC